MFTKPRWRLGRQQDDYNLDLEKAPSTPTTPLLNPETANPAAQHNREESIPVTKKKTSFYAKNIIIVVLVILIIAVAVGGAVGGARKKMSLNSRSTFSIAPSSTTSSSTQRSGAEQGAPGSVNQDSAITHPVKHLNRAAPGCIPLKGCNEPGGPACCVPSFIQKNVLN